MAKIKLPKNFRLQLSEKLMDLGNLAIVSLAFGQFIGNGELSMMLLFSGVFLMFACYLVSYIISL